MQDIENLRSKLREKLEWGKLATFVPNKAQPIYNWFYYKEGFAKELVLNLLEQFKLKPGHLVLDPFCGSGTTLLACHNKKRQCLAMDIEPECVAITIERWQQKTGDKAELVKRMGDERN